MNPVVCLAVYDIAGRITEAKVAHLINGNFEISAEQLMSKLVNYNAWKSNGGNDNSGNEHG